MRPLSVSTRHRLVDEATGDMLRARRLLAASTELIADSLAGHPRAVRYDRESQRSARLWCFTHERDHRTCARLGSFCGGTPMPGCDPAGEAATSPDAAAAAQRRIDDAVRQVAAAAQALAVELIAWSPPSTDMQRPDTTSATAPDGWCTSCWRNDRKQEPIGVRPGGTAPYYATMCAWCGSFKATHGYLPPVELLRLRHDGRRIYDRDIARYRPTGLVMHRATG